MTVSTAVRAIRGATTLDADSAEQMKLRVGELVNELVTRNALTNDDIISIMVTSTSDLRSMFPAGAVRMTGMDDVPLMGALEADVAGGLARCVRLMVHVNTSLAKTDINHVYLHGAAALRKDLADPS